MSLSNIIEKELEQLKRDIIIRHERSGQVASGKTKGTFEVKMLSEFSGLLLGAGYAGVLEKGRKPGGVPRDFIDILKRWAIAKRITFSNEQDFNRWANAVKWKIINDGTKLYSSRKTEDIFSTPIEQMKKRLYNKVSNYFDQEIKNQIFSK